MMKHILVMGGTSGIGRAVALRLAASSSQTNVSVVGRSAERGAEVEKAGEGRIRFFAADLTKPGAAADAVARCVDAFGSPLDAAVNSAAGVVLEGPKRLHELDDAAFDRELARELRICVDSLRAELAHACEAKRALNIVNVSSINGLGASPRAPFYSAVKAAQIALTKNAALDYAADGIRVNAVVLGAFETPMLSQVHDLMSGGDANVRTMMRNQFLSLVPVARFGAPEEAAAVIAWLCSTESSYVTGASWIVDGGLTAFAR